MELFPRFPKRLIKNTRRGSFFSFSIHSIPGSLSLSLTITSPSVKIRHPAVDFRISSRSLAGRTKNLLVSISPVCQTSWNLARISRLGVKLEGGEPRSQIMLRPTDEDVDDRCIGLILGLETASILEFDKFLLIGLLDSMVSVSSISSRWPPFAYVKFSKATLNVVGETEEDDWLTSSRPSFSSLSNKCI